MTTTHPGRELTEVSTKTSVTAVCDGGHCQEVPAEITRRFTVGGRDYETDLCGPCSAGLDAELAVFVKHARRVASRATAGGPKRRNSRKRQRDAAIRAWWGEHRGEFGLPYQDRGRLPGAVVAAYRAVKGM